MKTVVTSTHFKRAFYSRRSIAAVANQTEASTVHFHANIENTPHCDEIAKMVRSRSHLFAGYSTIIRESRPSCNDNIKAALQHALSLAPDFVIMVEDDVVLGRDSLAWFAKQAKQHRDNPEILTVSAWRHPDGWLPGCEREMAPDDDSATGTVPWFTPWGWGTWPDRLQEILANWTTGTDKEPVEDGMVIGSWDEHLNHRIRGNRLELHPMISRAINIGDVWGTHRKGVPLAHWIGEAAA